MENSHPQKANKEAVVLERNGNLSIFSHIAVAYSQDCRHYKYETNGHGCSSYLSHSQVVTYISPTSREAGGWDTGSPLVTTISEPTGVGGHGVVALWQKSDEALLQAAVTTTASNSQSAAPSSTFSGDFAGSTSTNSSEDNEPSGGLPTAGIVGIGVGIAVFVLIACLVAFFFWRRRKQTGHSGASPSSVELCGTSDQRYEAHSLNPALELGGKDGYRYELSAVDPPQEIAGGDRGKYNAHELP